MHIDEHEVHHLGLLLEELFPVARRQLVTIVNNAAGVTQGGFYRVEEYAFFCFLGESRAQPIADDLLSDENKKKATPIWFSHIRYGGINAIPSRRPNLVYPIGIDPNTLRIIGVGRSLKDRRDAGELDDTPLDEWRPDPSETVDGYPAVWPFRGDEASTMATWQNNADTLLELVDQGFVRVRSQPDAPGSNEFSVSYVKAGNRSKVASGEIETLGREEGGALQLGRPPRLVVPKTVWKRSRHDAGKWGSRVLKEMVGSTAFDYPKSPYAVRDALATVVGNNPNALIVDFFAGSGTTLHATMMLNAEDGGRRRAILVTNNEVDDATARRYRKAGLAPGDDRWEDAGIFRAVTRPRAEAAITGLTKAGEPLAGEYEDGRPYAQGFPESVEFFRLEYLDPDEVDLHRQFEAVLPSLWLRAGSVGPRPAFGPRSKFVFPDGTNFGVLFEETAIRDFAAAANDRPDLTHVYLVTDSAESFAEMVGLLRPGLDKSMLYRDYLRSFAKTIEV